MFYRFSCSQGRSLFTLPASQQRHLLAVSAFMIVSIIFYFCTTAFASSRECASIEAGESYYNLGATLSYFEDSSGLISWYVWNLEAHGATAYLAKLTRD